MDIFGDVPFVTEDSPFGAYSPAQKPRKEVFEYIESELLDLTKAEAKMPAARSNYPRADIGAVWGLLARLYLNAEVYTGTARWADAKKPVKKCLPWDTIFAPTMQTCSGEITDRTRKPGRN